jgi:hypothetical protein
MNIQSGASSPRLDLPRALFERQALLCQALADPKRLAIIPLLRDGEGTVNRWSRRLRPPTECLAAPDRYARGGYGDRPPQSEQKLLRLGLPQPSQTPATCCARSWPLSLLPNWNQRIVPELGHAVLALRLGVVIGLLPGTLGACGSILTVPILVYLMGRAGSGGDGHEIGTRRVERGHRHDGCQPTPNLRSGGSGSAVSPGEQWVTPTGVAFTTGEGNSRPLGGILQPRPGVALWDHIHGNQWHRVRGRLAVPASLAPFGGSPP